MIARIGLNKKTHIRTFRFHPMVRPFTILVITAIAITLPAVFFGIPSNRDLTNHFRFALPFYDAVTSGDLYPGWLAESNSGYGDASFRFYPPALYYLMTVVRLITGNWYATTLATFALVFLLGGFGVYGWVKTHFSNQVALWAAILFTLAPYHLNQFYQASLLAEFAACSVLPFCFWFVDRLIQEQTRRNVAGLAITFALLLLTHLPLAVLGSLTLLVYTSFRLKWGNRARSLISLTTAVLLGLLLSSFYWVTMIAEKNLIRADRVLAEPSVNYRLNFLFSTFSPDNLNVWWMNILAFSSLMMFAPSIILLWGRQQESSNPVRPAIVAVLIFAFLIATPVSFPLWALLTPLQETQFPWRWLGIVSLAGAALTATSLPAWFVVAKGKFRPVFLLAMSCVLISVAFSLSHIVREAQYLDENEFRSTLNAVRGSESVDQWLPVTAKDHVQEMSGDAELPGRAIQTIRWTPEKRVFSFSAGENTEARIRTYFYPYWTATAGDQKLSVKPSEDGVLLVDVPEQATTVTVEFVEPFRTDVANLVSLFGLACIVSLLVFDRLGRRISLKQQIESN